jgi:hypothetical protein
VCGLALETELPVEGVAVGVVVFVVFESFGMDNRFRKSEELELFCSKKEIYEYPSRITRSICNLLLHVLLLVLL